MKDRAILLLFFTAFALSSSGQPKACYAEKGERISIVVFLAVDCPVSQKYIPALNSIHRKYQNSGVDLKALVPGKTTRREIKQFKKEYEIGFDISADPKYDCAKSLHASVTPEVFVFDAKKMLKYRGAIDNWFYDLGGYRQQTTENYLIDAIDALLKGENPAVTDTESIGCPINIP